MTDHPHRARRFLARGTLSVALVLALSGGVHVARDADVVVIGHKEKYLRGRSTTEIEELLRAGAARVGVTGIAAYATEVASLEALVDLAEPGDVVGLMCHAERQQVYDWLEQRGATPDGPEQLRDKVGRASGRA